MEKKIIEFASLGFLAGIGLDELMRQVSVYVPELQQPSGIPIPGYDPLGIHYDDIIVLGGSAGMAVIGLLTKKYGLSAAGAAMALGSYMASVLFQGPGTMPTGSPLSINARYKSTGYARESYTPKYMF